VRQTGYKDGRAPLIQSHHECKEQHCRPQRHTDKTLADHPRRRRSNDDDDGDHGGGGKNNQCSVREKKKK
jgi:hypothetical protein